MQLRNRLAIGGSLLGITLLSWAYLLFGVEDMATGSGMEVIQTQPWTSQHFLFMFLMWAIMMIGMMVPSVTPMVMIYAAVARKSAGESGPLPSTPGFVSGYLIIWILFSVLATTAQWALDQAFLLSPMMALKSSALGSGLLILAGAYQWSPLKETCLQHCRSPIDFIANHWASGSMGALKMGMTHGVYCLGCCWIIMLLLFAGGVMNFFWIATIALFVLLEKLLPKGETWGKAAGLCMMLIGTGLLVQSI